MTKCEIKLKMAENELQRIKDRWLFIETMVDALHDKVSKSVYHIDHDASLRNAELAVELAKLELAEERVVDHAKAIERAAREYGEATRADRRDHDQRAKERKEHPFATVQVADFRDEQWGKHPQHAQEVERIGEEMVGQKQEEPKVRWREWL